MHMSRSAALPLLVAAVLVGVTACSPMAPTAPSSTHESTAAPGHDRGDPIEAWVDERMSHLTLEQKAASLLMLHAPGTDPAPLLAYVDAGVSGLLLMGDNVPGTPPELAALTSAVQDGQDAPVLIGIDEEGGEVQRLPWDTAASAETLRGAPAAAARDAFATRAATLADVGVSVNFGVVADVTPDPASFISGRVLGTDPSAAAERVAAAVSGERGVVLSTIKHFPGHGAAPGDSHSSVPAAPLTLEEWRSGPAIPFSAGIAAGADIVMTGHLSYPAVDAAPASLSPTWHRILRDELGFDGVIVTDDMLMLQHNDLPEFADPGENAVRAVAAGSDLLLYVLPADPSEFGISVSGLVASIVGAVQSGRISQGRLDDAVERVLTMRRSLATT
ncbi:glycoside hydrolase family 3 N-terminal domain-containing protein [Agromyces sp. Soil535]|uniref:glycoside hydrolase family 3 N-terminal domain-containing protein n=1 Tax=Agromyces sp. Soil535 TaxID=1736390 RepID=UPI0007003446|nr:glycoside hydrolase family 3 N-terminal domain-containing protein [Agromyces sp. Soil535]KRE23501.1 glycosyl hydrolase family 3 [Agromyces sp. Soil535]